MANEIQLSIVFGGQYNFEKLQSDWNQTDTLARDYIKNKPDLVNFETESIVFDENPSEPIGALKLQYNPDEKTLDFGLPDGGTGSLFKEMFEEYVNIDTVPLVDGMIVSTAAIPGNRKGIKRTDFTNLTSIRSIVGMVTVPSIVQNQSGRVTTKGIINNLNTSGIAEGTQLWGNPAVLGGWTGNKPTKPQYAVQIGQVVVAHATVGSVELNVSKDIKFGDLADVDGDTTTALDSDSIPVKENTTGLIKFLSFANIKIVLQSFFERVSNKKTTLNENSDEFYPTQKAVKTAVDLKFDKSNLESARSQSTTKAPTSKLLDDELNKLMPYDEFTKLGLNLFNKNAVIEGYYINASSGALTPNATSAVSPIIPVEGNTIYYLSGKNDNRGEIRYFDVNNNLLKPIVFSTGLESSNFNLAGFTNGKIITPSAAVSIQFNVKFTGTGTYDSIQLEKGDVQSPYFAYRKVISPDALENVAKSTDLTQTQKDLTQLSKSVTPALSGYSKRVNSNENTAVPSAFPTAIDVATNFSITISKDTESPVKDYVGYKRVFLTNLQSGTGTCQRTWTLPLANQARPSKVSIAFWTKKSEFQAIYASNFQSYFGLCLFSLNPTAAFTGTPVVDDGTVTSSVELSEAKLEFSVIAEVGDYVRIRLLYYDLVWKSTFTGSSMTYYWLFNGSSANGKPLTFIDFTVLLGDEQVGNAVYPDNGTLYGSPSIPYLDELTTGNAQRIDLLEKSNYGNGIRVKKEGNNLYIASPWSSSYDLVKSVVITRDSSFSNNPVLNFISDYLCVKDSDPAISAIGIKSSGDDITPANLNGSYIGGNHSWNQGYRVTSIGHGKTIADVGSVYKNASNVEFVIARIVDVDNIWMISKNQAVDGFSYSFANPSGTLTYVSNGDNTDSIVVGSTTLLGNTFTTISAQSLIKVLLDGKIEITENGTYNCKYVDVIESYDALDLPSIVLQLIANRPIGGYTTQPQLNGLAGTESIFNHSINYRFTKNGNTVVNTTFRAYKKLAFNFHGFIQAGALSSGNIYCPKSLPITVGATTYDLRQVSNWTNAPSASINLTSAYWENPLSPPDRVLNMNSNVNLMLGYITDRGIQSSRKDIVNNAIFLNTSRKIYPMGVSVAGNLEANSFYSCTAYRSYTNPANNPSGRTNYCWVEAGSDVFIFLDYHGALNDKIIPEAEWVGSKITVYEKNDKCLLIGDVVSGHIEIISTASANDYGFIVLKIN